MTSRFAVGPPFDNDGAMVRALLKERHGMGVAVNLQVLVLGGGSLGRCTRVAREVRFIHNTGAAPMKLIGGPAIG